MKFIGTGYSGHYKSVPQHVFNKFVRKEILSEDFLNYFYPYVVSYTGRCLLDVFSANEMILTPGSEEEARKQLDIIVDALIADDTNGYCFITMLKVMKKATEPYLEQDALVKFLFEKNFFKALKIQSSYINDFLDGIMANGKFKNAIELIRVIQEQIPDYKSFPLIVMNENLDKESKIAALKLVYKQKDLPSYKMYFREKLKNLNDLDCFIEATIMQKNRVKEKDDNLIRLIKDIFISGDYHSYCDIDRKGFIGIEEFSQKYSKKLSEPIFIRRLYNETVKSMSTLIYERREQYEAFLRLVFSSVDPLTKIKALQQCPELSSLGSTFSRDFRNSFVGGDYDTAKEILKVFVTWSENDVDTLMNKVGEELFSAVIDKFKDDGALDRYFENFNIISLGKGIKNPSRNTKIISKIDASGMISLLKEDIIDRVNFLDENTLLSFGFPYEEISALFNSKNKSGYYASYNTFPSIKTEMQQFIYALKYISESSSTTDEYMIKIINKFFKVFESSEKTEITIQSFMNLNNDSDTKSFGSWNNKSRTIDEVSYLMEYFKDVAINFYDRIIKNDSSFVERKENFISNIENVSDTINLVCISI